MHSPWLIKYSEHNHLQWQGGVHAPSGTGYRLGSVALLSVVINVSRFSLRMPSYSQQEVTANALHYPNDPGCGRIESISL